MSLAQIPLKLLPKTLKQEITLGNIGRINVLHKNDPKLYINTLVFIKKYGPAIKFYNEKLVFNHAIDKAKVTPFIQVFDQKQNLVQEFESGSIEPDAILQKIVDLNQGIKKE